MNEKRVHWTVKNSNPNWVLIEFLYNFKIKKKMYGDDI